MTRIHFYAADEDNRALREFVDSLELNVFSGELKRFGKTKSVPKNQYHGYITHLDTGQLKPYMKRKITHVTDPLVLWTLSYTMEYEGEYYIIHGCLEWEFEDSGREDDVKLGKSNFGKVSRWIRKNWPPPAKRDFCRGPEAQKLIKYKGYLARGIPPNIQVQNVKI